jgi:hypothetical protein
MFSSFRVGGGGGGGGARCVALQMRAVCGLVHSLAAALDRVEGLWLDACQPLGVKLAQLSQVLTQEYGRLGVVSAQPAAELLAGLAHGPSKPLDLWLSNQLVAEPLVLRMARSAEALCAHAEELLERHAGAALRRLVAHAGELHGEVAADEAFGDLEVGRGRLCKVPPL